MAALRARQYGHALNVPDFWTSQSHSTIRTQHGVQPFVPFDWQRQWVEGVTHKEALLKSRDVGSSEIVMRWACHKIMELRSGNVLVKADKHDNAKNLIAIARQYLTSLPSGERPTLTKDNETELELSGIGTIKAMAQGGGRSERCIILIRTEYAFVERKAEEDAAISGALVAGGWDIVETTANGFDEFHGLWVDEQNGYHKTFVGRDENPTHDAAWWAAKQQQLAQVGKTVQQEYPATPAEAFISSGNCVFDIAIIQQQLEYCKPPLATEFNGQLKIWERPRVGRRYVAGADVAEGIDAGNDRLDYSGVAIYDWQTGVHVADLHGQWTVDVFADMANTLCRSYNNAFLGVERNNHGHAVLLALQQLEYPALYYHEDPIEDLRTGKASTRRIAGWPTTRRTKPILEGTLASLLTSGGILSYDQAFWDECLSYVRHGDGSTGAQSGTHDDRCVKHMIALQMRDHMPATSRAGIVSGERFIMGG